jgi:hypothetical protein
MGYQKSQKAADREKRIQAALESLRNKEFSSIYAAADHHEVSKKTLGRRILDGKSQAQAFESKQILTNAEESTLVRWLCHCAKSGSFISPALFKELAQLLRLRRVRHASSANPLLSPPSYLRPIGHEWIYRFIQRHPIIDSIYARQMDAARYNGASFEVVKRWFDAVAEKFQERQYELGNIWNMDQTGFGVGESQSTKILIPINYSQKRKMVAGKQEWVIDFEYVNVSGERLTPLIIWKEKYLNSG